jgi:hypothetical protein
MIVYKFVNWDVKPAQEMTFESFIGNYNKYCSQVCNALNGCLKIGGWCYDFRDQLKKYLYKQRGEWREVYAPNKTAIRRSIYGRIDQIIAL